jgi:hypothetical protein
MTILEPPAMPPPGDLQHTLRALLDSQKVLYEQLLRSAPGNNDSVSSRPPSPAVSEGQAALEDALSLVDSVDHTLSSLSRPSTPSSDTHSHSLDVIAMRSRNANFFFEDRLVRISVSCRSETGSRSYH